jgi:hypothetical protein
VCRQNISVVAGAAALASGYLHDPLLLDCNRNAVDYAAAQTAAVVDERSNMGWRESGAKRKELQDKRSGLLVV